MGVGIDQSRDNPATTDIDLSSIAGKLECRPGSDELHFAPSNHQHRISEGRPSRAVD
jgi:hypothetical protein